MARASRKHLAANVIGGIEHARKVHAHISRRRFDQAPESWVASMIAMYLARKTPGYGVELEARVEEVMRAAGACPRGRVPKDLRIGGRADIVLWWKAKKGPRALIEVKHPLRAGNINSVVADARRLLSALHRGAAHRTLDWGCLAFFCSSSPKRSKTQEMAETDISATLRKLKAKVRALNRDELFYTKLEAGPLRKSVDATKTNLRYGRACRLSMFRRRSAYEMLAD